MQNRSTFRFLPLLFLFALTACKPDGAPDAAADMAALQAAAENWLTQYNGRNADGVAAIYSEQAKLMPPGAPALDPLLPLLLLWLGSTLVFVLFGAHLLRRTVLRPLAELSDQADRLASGAMLEVSLPAPDDAPTVTVVAEPVPGMRIVHDDDDLVVVDKPVGVAAHPSVGWTGPDVVGGLAAAGYRISTSGAPERQGIVSRLDVGTSGLMVVAKSEYAYSRLKQAFRTRAVDKNYHALVQGLPDPLVGAGPHLVQQ